METVINHPSDFYEILTTVETLTRLKIGRTKLFQLIKRGALIPGRHYFKNGRVLRFIWSRDLIEAINEKPVKEPELTIQQAKNLSTKTIRTVKKSTINLDY